MGIGTSDFGASQIDAGTQVAPPPLEMSSFLQDLCLDAVSSPVAQAPVSVLSPSFQRFLDRESAAVVETGEASTDYDPPVGTLPAAPSPLAAGSPELVEVDTEQSDVPSAGSTESLREVADDLPIRSPLSAESVLEGAVSNLAPATIATSPMGPSLLDSDDEPIASRLPGYLSSFKSREVSD